MICFVGLLGLLFWLCFAILCWFNVFDGYRLQLFGFLDLQIVFILIVLILYFFVFRFVFS